MKVWKVRKIISPENDVDHCEKNNSKSFSNCSLIVLFEEIFIFNKTRYVSEIQNVKTASP